MDTDPLQDTLPPRYAVESDDEEDEINPLSAQNAPPKAEVNVLGELPTSGSLVIATGQAGRIWAQGANLGEQTAAVAFNGVQVGLVFRPSWTKSTVIISEALTRLPLHAYHPYAQKILDTVKPSKLALLDTYPAPTYATQYPIPFHEAPLRYLSTTDNAFPESSAVELFAPPNLIHSSSASFLSIVALPTPSSPPTTLILLPSPHIATMPPKEVSSKLTASDFTPQNTPWPTTLVTSAQNLLFQSVGEAIDLEWKPSAPREKPTKTISTVGEGGMYI